MDFHKEVFVLQNDFRINGKLIVRSFGEEDRTRLDGTLRKYGFSAAGGRRTSERARAVRIDLHDRTWQEQDARQIPFSEDIRFYSVTEFARMAELDFRFPPRFLFFHVPHDGSRFPGELLSSVCVSKDRFQEYHDRMCDTGVSELIPEAYRCPSMTERFPVSRLLCDPERFIGSEEIMERYGMGFCYEKAYDGTVIKNVTEPLKKETLRYYREHHKKIDEKCRRHSKVLLFDLHSYSDEIVPEDFLVPGRETPDVCIGTDRTFTSRRLYETVRLRLEEAGFRTAENYPYGGCLIPNTVLAGNSDCVSVMLEFHKRVYLDADGKPDAENAARIRKVMERIAADCIRSGEWTA